jgi:uncharacterized protein
VLLLLPPSETKRDGGTDGSSLDLSALRFASLTAARHKVLDDLARLSADPASAIRALKLGPTQAHELERNLAVRSSATMPAIERYTGVLYDGLDYATVGARGRDFAKTHLVIHSALFGLVGANDPIPAYRMSHNTRLPSASPSAVWKKPIAAALAETDGLILDLRSQSYARLGPAPARSTALRVATRGPDGTVEALSHFNKKAKGEFTRAVVSAAIVHDSTESLVDWARSRGFELSPVSANVLELVV